MPELGTVYVVDNHGSFYESNYFVQGLKLSVDKPGRNLGWTSALARTLPRVSEPYVLFLNDDTEFERVPDRLALMLSNFEDTKVGAVGPATGIAMGYQAFPGPDVQDVKLLIGFCLLLRKSVLTEVGGVDESFGHGGDDLDLCARLTDAGYRLLLDRRVFVFHHAFKTGNRLFGNSRIPGGWNSAEMAKDVYDRISKKYGKDRLLEMVRAPDFKPEEVKLGH